jgi:hypothetical protein
MDAVALEMAAVKVFFKTLDDGTTYLLGTSGSTAI